MLAKFFLQKYGEPIDLSKVVKMLDDGVYTYVVWYAKVEDAWREVIFTVADISTVVAENLYAGAESQSTIFVVIDGEIVDSLVTGVPPVTQHQKAISIACGIAWDVERSVYVPVLDSEALAECREWAAAALSA